MLRTHIQLYALIATLCVLCVLCPRTFWAAAAERPGTVEHPDTAIRRSLSIDEVVVTGTRSATDARLLPATVTIIDRAQIEQSLRPSLLPIVTELTPGLFSTARGVMGYGVSGGAAGALSLRGLSSSSGRMMVLIDGHPQYMGLMGHPIADACQSLMAERVEVLRGPASVLYGSNAMGGVVNIFTRKMREQGTRADLRLGYGSCNTLQSEATGRTRRGRCSGLASITYNRTDGHRPNMDFEQYGGFVKLGCEIGYGWDLSADANIIHFNASNPGTVQEPLLDADQRITRGAASLTLSNNSLFLSGALSIFYNWGRHKINDGYPVDGGQPLDYRFRSHDNMAGISWHQSAQLYSGNRFTVGFDWYRFGGDKCNYYVAGQHAGQRAQYVEKIMHEVAGYVDFRQSISTLLTFDAGLRIDRHSHVGTEWIPQFGLSLHLNRSFDLKLSAAKGFRYPTIREMYMFPPQNPDLRPERMWSYEIALEQRPAERRVAWGINLFYIDGDNLIVAVPRPGAAPLNINTGKIDNCGVEAQISFGIGRSWSVDANYSFLHMDNPVPAAPEHKLYAGASFVRGRWTVSSGVQCVAGLYTSTAPVAKERFTLWNLQGQYRPARWIELWVRGENLLSQHYAINSGYPMPTATLMGGMNFKL